MKNEPSPESDYPEFYTGAPVDASDLLFRDGFIDDLWDSLLSQHVLLSAPRRTGKTSVMDALRTTPRHGFTIIYENVQDLSHPADFFIALLARFHEEHPRFLRDHIAKGWDVLGTAFGKVEEVGFSEFKVALRESDPNWKENWRKHGEAFFQQIRRHGSPVLIITDEFPDFVLNLRDHDAKLEHGKDDQQLLKPFLSWLRTQRQNPKPADDPIRWLIGGSVNLSSTLDALGLIDRINDIAELPLPVLTDEDVLEFVDLMLSKRGAEFEADVPRHVLDLLGRPIPIFLQMVTQDLYRLWKRRHATNPVPLSRTDVGKVFDDLVTSNAARSKLKHYYSRLERYYVDPSLAAAHQILSELSLSPDGLKRTTLLQSLECSLQQSGHQLPDYKRKQLFNNLLADLENDFYVMELAEERYDFASGILKSWWRKYYA